MTLTEFLRARIAEDETNDTTLIGVARKDWAARWLAECDAKRRIVDLHVEREYECSRCDTGYWDENDDGAEVYGARPEAYPCETLRTLALPYADHPDYRDEWRP